jgi:hypothetical protein
MKRVVKGRGDAGKSAHKAGWAVVEAVEPRRMLSAAVSHGILLIDGTPRSDTIVLVRGKRAVQVSVDGTIATFSLKWFSEVRIRAGKGNDLVTIGTADGGIDAAGSVLAGAGNDTIVTSAGNDTVFGEDGDDEISTSAGDDLVDGGAGHDLIFGGDGNDRLYGGANADTIFGNYGDDVIRGDRGDDQLRNGPGRDTVFGDGDNDYFGNMLGGMFPDMKKSEHKELEFYNYELVVTDQMTLGFTNVFKTESSYEDGAYQAGMTADFGLPPVISNLWAPKYGEMV